MFWHTEMLRLLCVHLQLFPRRCTWLYVMNNCLLSISGELSHIVLIEVCGTWLPFLLSPICLWNCSWIGSSVHDFWYNVFYFFKYGFIACIIGQYYYFLLTVSSISCFIAGKASQLYSHSLSGMFEQARQLQKLPVAIPTHKLPDKIIPR